MMRHDSFLIRKMGAAWIVAGLSLSALSLPAGSATTDLANIPLINATAATVLPNIFFILDNSGSMGSTVMPDDAGSSGYWNSSHCNGLYYNPDVTYSPPLKYDGTSYSNSTFTAAWNNGYDKINNPVSIPATTNLSGQTYYVYTGTEPDLGFTYNTSGLITSTNFYLECNSSTGKLATTILLGGGGGKSYSVTSIKVNGVELLSAPTVSSNARDTVGSRIASNITLGGYSATYNSSTDKVTISSPDASVATMTPVITTSVSGSGSTMTFAPAAFPGAPAGLGKFNLITVGAAEQQNYANWYSYYRTRMNMAKTSIGRAFNDIRGWPLDPVVHPEDADYVHARVGFTTISDKTTTPSTTYEPIDDFNREINTEAGHTDNSQKKDFYKKLYLASGSSTTPLRGALAKAGRLYGGKGNDDPIKYSCQKNYTILTTDGYWNTGSDTTTYNAVDLDNNLVGDRDGVAGVTRPSYDALHKPNSLADIAYYYYHTDLRPGMFNNVPSSGNVDSPTEDVAAHQHMTTFTIGMGVNGLLQYDENYKSETATSPIHDYFDVENGTKDWPDPKTSPLSTSNTVIERIDDLWHAAVNGRGTYFSAKNPQVLETSLKKALQSIAKEDGSGAAAGTSSLNPVAGNNYAYVATYATNVWSGDLRAYTIDPETGAISSTSQWSAAEQLRDRIPAAGNSESPARNIKTGVSSLKDFQWADLTATERAYFDNTKLSQYADWNADQLAAGKGENMLNYLRGWTVYEEQASATQQLYRDRQFNLGDIVHSQPIFVKEPSYSFTDPGYSAYKADQATRAGAVYVGGNDGMLHAFDSATGSENWAYVPPVAMPLMWLLADTNYASKHVFFVDGPMATADAYVNGGWKTILTSSLGKGGRGYFALDVTSPSSPSLLWNFTAKNTFGAYSDENVGYTYASPLMTKLNSGTWVALATSGYNNIPEGTDYSGADGSGRVFVLDLADGHVIKTIKTNVGTVSTPSGLSRLNIQVANYSVNNTALMAYGGDLLGNMWRFDLEAGTATLLFKTPGGQPITTAPEIGEVDGYTVIMFGTGRYLGQDDLDDLSAQAIYAIKDDGSTPATGPVVSGVTDLVQQVITGTLITKNAVDWSSKSGWYVNLISAGERVNVDPQLHLGTLMFATTIPKTPGVEEEDAAACSPGGTGRFYQLDYRTGGYVGSAHDVSPFTDLGSPLVGFSPAHLDNKTPEGKNVVIGLDAKGTKITADLKYDSGTGAGGSTSRVLWRELVN